MVKYYLIGEIHGTNECPAACLDILYRHGLTRLALEFDKRYQSEFDEFIEGKRAIDDLTVFQEEQRTQDGRTSQAMRQLLLTARTQRIHLYCVDDWSDPQQRDEHMARNLQQLAPPIGYFCGQAHAAKKNIFLNKDDLFYETCEGVFTPCGSFLLPEETLSYKIFPVEGGTFYNLDFCTAKGNEELAHKYRDFPIVIPSPEAGYDFWYLVRRFTPST